MNDIERACAAFRTLLLEQQARIADISTGRTDYTKKAKSKSRQNRCGELRELERNVKVHLSEKPLPEAARGSFVLVAELAYAALYAQLTGIKTYPAYMQSAASHNEISSARIHNYSILIKALNVLNACYIELCSVLHAYAVGFSCLLLFFLICHAAPSFFVQAYEGML